MSQTIKFGVGKYKTRDDEDVEIVAVVGEVAIGYIHDDPLLVDTWSPKTGRYFIEGTEEHSLDLIDPNAKRPIKQELWLTIYKSDSRGVYAGGGYASKEVANGSKCNDCIAIAKVTIDCLEGDCLE